MKILASLVTSGFLLLGAFVPTVVKATGETGLNAIQPKGSFKPLVDTQAQTQAKAEYTISYYQDYVISHESGWRTDALNPGSGACGLIQALPCSKMPCGMSQADFDCQMKFANEYAMERYGSWEAAYNFWIRTDARPYPGHWW